MTNLLQFYLPRPSIQVGTFKFLLQEARNKVTLLA